MNAVTYIQKQIEAGTEQSKKQAETQSKEFQLTNEKFSHIKARAYIKNKAWPALLDLVSTVNAKNKIVIPYDYIFELLDKGENRDVPIILKNFLKHRFLYKFARKLLSMLNMIIT